MGSSRQGYTLRLLTGKVLGSTQTRDYPAGTPCRFERAPNAPGAFIVWFSRPGRRHPQIYVKVDAIDLPTTIKEA